MIRTAFAGSGAVWTLPSVESAFTTPTTESPLRLTPSNAIVDVPAEYGQIAD